MYGSLFIPDQIFLKSEPSQWFEIYAISEYHALLKYNFPFV